MCLPITSHERITVEEYHKMRLLIVPSFALHLKNFTPNQVLLLCGNFRALTL